MELWECDGEGFREGEGGTVTRQNVVFLIFPLVLQALGLFSALGTQIHHLSCSTPQDGPV